MAVVDSPPVFNDGLVPDCSSSLFVETQNIGEGTQKVYLSNAFGKGRLIFHATILHCKVNNRLKKSTH